MLRDVFYYGLKPNAHPRERFAKNLAEARAKSTTEHFWIINEFCDYSNFEWDFDFEFLPDEDVWAEDHINIWPSQHQKDSGTWLVNTDNSNALYVYRNDVEVVKRKNIKTDNWVLLDSIDELKFDFSWHPDPTDPPYVYKWGCKYFPAQLSHVLEYRVKGASQEKYMNEIVELLPNYDYIIENQKIDRDKFDLSWRPDPLDPPFIYVWGNKYVDGKLRSTLEYHVPGATEKKYMPELLTVLPEWEKWHILHNVDKTSFDFSWRPDPREPDFIYVFGNEQYDSTVMSTIEYKMQGATTKKYITDVKAKLAPHPEKFEHLEKADGIDYSWVPDPTAPPYIYAWGNQWNKPEDKISIQYVVEGATEYKYMEERANRKPSLDNWVVPDNVDISGFDFSWEPSPKDPPFIYEFGTQHQKTGGPRYIVEGATEIKYLDIQKAKALPTTKNWTIPNNLDITGFDFSWHPDSTSPPYIYHFATQWALTGGPIYKCEGASEVKYLDSPSAVALPDRTNWKFDEKVIDVDTFDFSWHPYIEDQPYVYVFGTQHQKTGGPKFITPGCHKNSPVKYIDTRILKAQRKPNKKKFNILNNYKIKDFDWSWHPDETDEPYIYIFGNNQYSAEIMPTIEYVVKGAKQVKYVNDVVATLDKDRTNWVISTPINEKVFDFTWKPNPKDPPYIYRWGNKFVSNKFAPTIEYHVPDATEIKYMNDDVEVTPEWDRWEIPKNVDVTGFDFTWRPDPLEPNFIWQFGTQWQKTGGPRYVMPNASEVKYVNTQRVRKLADKKKFSVLNNLKIKDFDWSWHPDETEEPYIYVFGNNQYSAEIMPTIEYTVSGATKIKYVRDIVATLDADKRNWEIPDDVDTTAFDFSWKPNPKDPSYVYQFGTQHQKTGGPKYIAYDGIGEVKFIDTLKVKKLANKNNFKILNNLNIVDFDFSWHPDETDEPYIYVFGNNQYPAEIMPTIEYIVEGATQVKYISNITATLGKDMTNWVVPNNIDTSTFDFSWKPNPKDPPFIYEFGTQHQKTGGPRYIVPDATEVKYIDTQKVLALPTKTNWIIPNHIDIADFDFSWHPDNTDPLYIYQFGTQWALSGGPKYVMPGATEVKYVDDPIARALPNKDNWDVPSNVDASSFDFSWHPYVEDQPYIYQFGTQHQKTGGPKYITPGTHKNSQIKYIDTRILQAKRLPNKRAFSILNNYKIKDFDYSWHPDTTEEPYIYVFGNNQYPAEVMPTIEYAVPGAKQIKYVYDVIATLAVDMNNWEVPTDIDTTGFDFSWKPNPNDPPYIYQFGTQHQKTGGPRYIVPDANEVKYVSTQCVIKLENKKKFAILNNLNIHEFDFSWHPDDTDEPYIYIFGNNHYAAEIMPTIEYAVPGAKQIKYVNNILAVLGVDKTNWEIPNYADVSAIDFTWKPNPNDPPYIYQFGTQWQKTGGPRYIVDGALETKYIDTQMYKATRLPNKRAFAILNNYKIKDFDYSWHPDSTEEPYIYVFGNNQYPAEIMPTIEYVVPGATQVKYINDIVATLDVDMANWEVPDNIDTSTFDFSWKPNPKDPPFIYEFGTQHQKTGGPRYVVSDATEIKYVDTMKVRALPTTKNWTVPSNIDIKDFDFSWHPDNTDPAYIYQFGTQWALSGGPRYTVVTATEIKYMDNMVAKALANKENWEIPAFVDQTEFDFSWHPYAEDEPYIYQFGTQHQKTGGPKYITPGTHKNSQVKYIDVRILKAKRLPNKRAFAILNNYKIKEFDWSWHPDTTEEPYIYVFGNNQYSAEVMPTIEYVVPGAKQIKYVNDIIATLDVDMTNWEVPKKVDVKGFDFSWKPNPKDPPYIYEFGTQWQKTGGPRYVIDEATETKYIDSQKVLALPDMKNWTLPSNIDVSDFDFSWHPDSTSPPYNYHFATQWAISGGPEYKMEGAIAIKYMDTPVAKALPNKEHWEIPLDIDSRIFDFSWHPYAEDDPFIYQFGTQWQKTGGPKYITPGAKLSTAVKYIDTRILKAQKLPNRNNFEVFDNLQIAEFDFSWHPDATDGDEYIYVFGNTQYPAEVMPTLKYVSGPYAHKIKYINDVVAKLAPDRTNWEIPNNVDVTNFDFSWKPNPNDPPYIYQFGTQWQKTGGPKYIVDGAAEVKYIEGSKARRLPSKRNWIITDNILESSFDFSWHPDSTDADEYIYVFGNTQYPAEVMPTVKYVPSLYAEKVKYIKDIVAELAPSKENWEVPDNLNVGDFDFSWKPNPNDPPFIYQFGTQWQKSNGPRYVVKGATDVKYVEGSKAKILPNKQNWFVPDNIIESSFDFSWHPDANSPPYIYQFGTQHQKTNGPKYVVSGATEIQYVDSLKAKIKPNKNNWVIPDNVDVSTFDFSWHPDDTAPPYIYQFGDLLDRDNGPIYMTPGATGEKVYLERIEVKIETVAIIDEIEEDIINVEQYYLETTLDDLVKKHPNKVFWALNKNIDYTNFDFNWRPDSLRDMEYVQVFGSPESELTHTYFVNSKSYSAGNKNFKFIENLSLNESSLSKLFVKPDMFFVDKGNAEAANRFEKLKTTYGNRIQKTRYLNSWVDTINRCINRSNSNLCWILNSELDYTGFNFDYYPNPWQMKMIHVFGTQWSHWGTTFMVNRETFSSDTKYIKIIEHLNNLNFVKDDDKKAKASECLYDIVVVDHGNKEMLKVFRTIQAKASDKSVTTIEYKGTYLDTFKEILSQLPEKKEQYIWVCSSICDYTNFDFTYICDPFAKEQLHVFPSDRQKFGDTFLVNINKLRELVEGMEVLQDYQKIHFNQHMRTKRYSPPVIVSEYDTHVASVLNEFNYPYAVFVTEDNKDIEVIDDEPMNLWSADTKNITITSTGGTRVIVPKEVKQFVETQLYDYPYIKKTERLAKSEPLDIVYLSNGETCADENYEHLINITKDLKNRIVRVDGVNGRVAAYHAAAHASNTPWMFTVFAKLKVSPRFDFNWQPDRLQIPKHYMFNAKNPVNGLVYGHQGIIAYNKKLVLANTGNGLDFTLDDPHESVKLLSGVAHFNTDPFSTWRTAFREVIKLKNDSSEISQERLETWLTVAEGDYAEYCLKGANDAIAYYKKVKGNYEKLKLSYEWKWLSDFYNKKYK